MWVKACNARVSARAFVFDKDGTIFSFSHWVALMEARVECLARYYQFPPSFRDELLTAMGVDPLKRKPHPNGAIHFPRREVEELAAQLLAGALGLPYRELLPRVEELFAKVDAEFPWEAHLQLLPGVRALLKGIKAADGKVAVVTHDSTRPAELHLRFAELEGLVDVVVGLDSFHAPKPAPDGILLACALLGVLPGETAMVGDSPADILAGKRAGCRLTIGVLTGRGTAETLSAADCVVKTLEEIEVTTGE
ncbi:HAD family hydrolase [Candidatus Bipolaricaulota sp. J31]